VADDPIYSALNAKTLLDPETKLIAGAFDRLERSYHYPTAKTIFAAHKPRDLLLYSQREFVLFIDADIVTNEKDFPEALFDRMHLDYDLVLPIDWAHRHGPLCECFSRGF
jgi:hypothetical protein